MNIKVYFKGNFNISNQRIKVSESKYKTQNIHNLAKYELVQHIIQLSEKGTIFYVFFPKSELDAVEEYTTSAILPTGKEKILIVDDEEGMAEMIGAMVRRLGYQETFETSSTKALEIFKSNPEKFDLVITDQTMPEMTGMELAEELMRIRPDIPIILCTGYSKKVTEEKVKDMGIKELLIKPIEREQLACTVRDVLDERG